MQPEQQQRIMGYFIEEAKEHLNTIEQGLLNLQSTLSDPEMTNELFRAAHSVKGGAAMLGLNSIQRVAHRLEDFFKVLKDSPVQVDQKLETLFLQVFDALQELLAQLQSPFGLSEDTANATVAGVEPTFAKLEQHLNTLATATPVPAAPPAPEPVVAVSRPESALVLLFNNDIPVRLREMLQLFKQSETDPAVRQALQSICRSLISIGEQFELPDWCKLVQMASQAIANSDHSYRTLAPIIIKDIKQAQELVLAGRAEEICPCVQLQDLVPPPAETSADVNLVQAADDLDFADFLAADVSEVVEEPSAASAHAIDPTFEEFAFGEPLEAVSSASANFDSSLGGEESEQQGPEVGIAELNTLADLFEGEVPDLGSTWQDEEVLEGVGSARALDGGSDADVQNDFNDFSDLFDQPAAQPPGAADADLNQLFEDELLEDSELEGDAGLSDFSNLDAAPADSLAADLPPESLEQLFPAASLDDAGALEDLNAIETPPPSEETDLFGDLDLDAFSEATDLTVSSEPALSGLDGLFEDLDNPETVNGTGTAAPIEPLADPFGSPLPPVETDDLWSDEPFSAPALDNHADSLEGSGSAIELEISEVGDLFGEDLAAPEPLEELTDSELDFSALLESPAASPSRDAPLEVLSDDSIDLGLGEDWTDDVLPEPQGQQEQVRLEPSQLSLGEVADPWETYTGAKTPSQPASDRFEDVAIVATPDANSDDLTADLWSTEVGSAHATLSQDFAELTDSNSADADFAALDADLNLDAATDGEPIELRDDLSFDLADLDSVELEPAQAEVSEAIEELRLEDDLSDDALNFDLDDLGLSDAPDDLASGVEDLDLDELDVAASSDAALEELLASSGEDSDADDLLLPGLEPAFSETDLDFDRPAQLDADLDLFGSPEAAPTVAQDLNLNSNEDILLESGETIDLNEASPTDDLFALDALESEEFTSAPDADPFGFAPEVNEAAEGNLFNGLDDLKIESGLGELDSPASPDLALEDDLFSLELEPPGSASESSALEVPLDDLFGSDSAVSELEAPSLDLDSLDLFDAAGEGDAIVAPAAPSEDLSEGLDAESSLDLDSLDLFDAAGEGDAIVAPAALSEDLSEGLEDENLDLSLDLDAALEPDAAAADLDLPLDLEELELDAALSPNSIASLEENNFENDFAGLQDLQDLDTDVTIVSGLDLGEDELLGLEALVEPTTATLPSDADPFGFDLPDYGDSDRTSLTTDDISLGLDELGLGAGNSEAGLGEEFDFTESEATSEPKAVSDAAIAADFSDLNLESNPDSSLDLEDDLDLSDELDLFGTAELSEAVPGSREPGLDLEADLFDLGESEAEAAVGSDAVLDFAAPADNNFSLDAFNLDETLVEAEDLDSPAAGLEADLFGLDAIESSIAPDAIDSLATQDLDSSALEDLDLAGLDAPGDAPDELDLFLDDHASATAEGVTPTDLGEDLGFGDSADLGELDQLLNESAADSFNGLDDLLLESSPAESLAADPFDSLDDLLGSAPEVGDGLEGLEDAEGTSKSDFSELDSLLDEPSPSDPFGDLDDLLGAAVVPAAAIGAAGLVNHLSQSAPTASEDEFGDLEALLQGADVPAQPTELMVSPTTDAGFDELDDLLKEAEEKMGGSPTVKSSRSALPPTRRPARSGRGFVEQTMRVPVKHLDNLSNLVGELVVNRNSLEQDQERLRQSLDNLLYQVQQLSDVGQRMQDLYERSLLESSLLASRQGSRSAALTPFRDTQAATQTVSSPEVEYDPLEMDRFTGFHSLSQEMIELIVRVRESASDIEFIVEETDQVTRMFRQVTTQLQEGLTRSRMVPFAQTADRLPRAVRDISMKVGKQVELQIEGRETLIDKMILEQLYDPMTHLVNNALTHGIESPEARRAAGKPATGRITIRAFHQGNQTIISVSDDGAGIDVERVKAKAIEKGIVTPTEAKAMSRLDVYDLLFQAGFSTKDKADDFSGRGVGMDVVRTSLSEIRGVVNTDSTPGKGTSFTIRLPLTLSISKALCCISDRARVAFPMDGVEDMLDLPKERLQTNADGKPSIPWRDSLLPLYPLSELLGYNRHLSRGNVYGGNQEDDITSIVVLRSAGNFLALQVDQVLGEQEIVIKQLEGPIPKPVGVAGATVLGDGRIMPIADVLELIDLSMGRLRKDSGGSLWEQGAAQVVEPPVAKTEPTVLIVDDSITVRELLSMTFNKVGYRVEQARDGQEAWEKLRSGLPCDIVFCDIEMPRMDGLELLSRIQKDPNLNHLPIAMLTSRGADRHRQMAASLGANGYFTKPYLEEALLDAAQRMLKGEVLLSATT